MKMPDADKPYCFAVWFPGDHTGLNCNAGLKFRAIWTGKGIVVERAGLNAMREEGWFPLCDGRDYEMLESKTMDALNSLAKRFAKVEFKYDEDGG
jgi:hypothetical protein